MNELHDHLRIGPASHLSGEIEVPGDSRISRLALVLAALADGKTRLRFVPRTEEVLTLVRALQALGVWIEFTDAETMLIVGAKGRLAPACEVLEAGPSSLNTRLLLGLLASQRFPSKVAATRPELSRDRLVSPPPSQAWLLERLAATGARITADRASTGDGSPWRIEPTDGPLKGVAHVLTRPTGSGKAALLLAGILSEGTTTVTEPAPYSPDHFEKLLELFNRPIRSADGTLSILGGGTLYGCDLELPGDFSLAALWICAAAALPDAHLAIRGVGLNRARTALLGVLVRMNAGVRESLDDTPGDPRGRLVVAGKTLRAVTIAATELPGLRDELPLLMALAAIADGETTFGMAPEGFPAREGALLRAMIPHLRAFGALVEERTDCLAIKGGGGTGATTQTNITDPRVARGVVLLAMFSRGITHVYDSPGLTGTYPGFAEHLAALTGQKDRLISRVWRGVRSLVEA